MADYKININKNEIIYNGISFKVDELKLHLKKHGAELFKTITCPGKIKYVLTEEAKMLIRQKKGDSNASG